MQKDRAAEAQRKVAFNRFEDGFKRENDGALENIVKTLIGEEDWKRKEAKAQAKLSQTRFARGSLFISDNSIIPLIGECTYEYIESGRTITSQRTRRYLNM